MLEFLNNASTGAFIGAFSAYFLVVATDWRRRRRYKKLLTYLVSDNIDHARNKMVSIETNIALIKEDGKVTGSSFMHFPTQAIKDYQLQVLDMLGANEKQGLEALIFWMENIDTILDECTENANNLISIIKNKVSDSSEDQAINDYVMSLEEAKVNLKYLIELSGYYVKGEAYKILEFSHEIGNT